MRDKLIHDYLGVNVAAVWDTIQMDLPLLKKDIIEIIDKNQGFLCS